MEELPRVEELRVEEQEELLRVEEDEEEELGQAVELFDAAGFVAMLRVVSSPQVPELNLCIETLTKPLPQLLALRAGSAPSH